jgi:hypothetical protein
MGHLKELQSQTREESPSRIKDMLSSPVHLSDLQSGSWNEETPRMNDYSPISLELSDQQSLNTKSPSQAMKHLNGSEVMPSSSIISNDAEGTSFVPQCLSKRLVNPTKSLMSLSASEYNPSIDNETPNLHRSKLFTSI